MNHAPPPIHRSDSDLPKNIFPHLLRNKEYDLEFLKWALKQTYMGENVLNDIANRINEI
jgi:hypothetical protein